MKNYKIKTSFVGPDEGLSSKYRAEKFAHFVMLCNSCAFLVLDCSKVVLRSVLSAVW